MKSLHIDSTIEAAIEAVRVADAAFVADCERLAQEQVLRHGAHEFAAMVRALRPEDEARLAIGNEQSYGEPDAKCAEARLALADAVLAQLKEGG